MNNIIVITGASSEIGLAIIKKLAHTKLILQCFQNKDKLVSICDQLKINAEIITADFNNNSQLESFCNAVKDADCLINNAAFTKTDLLPLLSNENISKMVSVNILANVKITQAVLPAMVAKRNGCIINISSVAAHKGNKGQSVYAGTKGFIESFTKSLAAEYGRKGIRVNAIAPGPIESGSLKDLLSYAPEEVKQSISLQRLGKPEDVANMVEFLVNEKSSFITGAIFNVDGGFTNGI